MTVAIVIPTYKRVEKLSRCIRSIYDSTYTDWRIIVVADNMDAPSVVYAHSLKDSRIETLVQPEHKFVIGAWNRFTEEYQEDKNWDAMLWCCDDVEFYRHAIQQAVAYHHKHFPDGDGVIGFKQVCHGHDNYNFKWFGQCLIGRKFIERYKDVDYKVCCPDYVHFYQDEEMWNYADSLGKFKNCPTAILNHYHPSFVKEEEDETHNIIRSSKLSPKSKDISTHELRLNRGLIWGKSWELINKGE